MYPNALILSDHYDCKKHMFELVEHCASYNLRPKVIQKDHWPSYFEESLASFQDPILFYANSSLIHSHEVLDFHRSNRHFPLLLSQEQEILSFRPDLIEVRPDGQFVPKKGKHPFRLKGVHSELRNPPIDPLTICILLHERKTYAQLTYNSIIYSLGAHADEVPIVLVVNGDSYEMQQLTKEASLRDNVEILHITPNVGSAASYYIRKWFWENRPEVDNVILIEDDFILPASVKYVYPNWPWTFAQRLQYFDLVCWLPSLDNLPQLFYKQSRYTERPSIGQITRSLKPTQSWITNDDNPQMFLTGNALGYSFKFYDLVCKTVAAGSVPTDYNFFQIASRVCAPKIFGYHIGWNQEQDGFKALHDLSRWETPINRADIYADKLDKITTIGF